MKLTAGLATVLAAAVTACGNSSGDLPDARPVQIDANPMVADASTTTSDAVPVHHCNPSDVPTLVAAFADDTCTTVTIAAGTYQGNFFVTHDVAIVGAGIGMTILDGNSSGSVLQLEGNTLSSVTQMTIQNGKQAHGGAIEAMLPLSVTDVDFENNVADQSGGAIDMGISTDGATLTILRGTFANNAVQGLGDDNSGQGGAIFADGLAVSIMDSTFTSNSIVVDGGDVEGGAIYLRDDSSVDIENTTFTTNSISTATQNGDGGALAIDDCAVVTIATCQFVDNTATATAGSLNGGAIDIYAQTVTPMVIMTSDSFMGNSATGCGVAGGALTIEDSSLTASMLTFQANQAVSSTLANGSNNVFGGAVSAGDSNTSVAFQDSVFSGNTATLQAPSNLAATGSANGGALSVDCSLSLTDVVISDNTAASDAGSGVHGGGLNMTLSAISNVSVVNSSIVGNTATLSSSTSDQTFISGGGVYLSCNQSPDCQVEFANTFIVENDLIVPGEQNTVLIGPQVDLEAYGASLLTVAFRNVTLLTDEDAADPQVLATYTSDTSTIGLDFGNTILDAHNDSDGCVAATGVEVASSGYNLISANCLTSPTTGDIILSEANGDPASDLSTQLTTDSGFPYYAITFDSPAFNGGDPTGCINAEGVLLTTDALGQPRFGNCDIGAFEVQPLPP